MQKAQTIIDNIKSGHSVEQLVKDIGSPVIGLVHLMSFIAKDRCMVNMIEIQYIVMLVRLVFFTPTSKSLACSC